MNRQNTERVITLEDIWGIFVSHLIPIALAGIIAVSIMMAYGRFGITPKYNSTATIYILKQDNSREESSNSDFNLALNVVNDCAYMVKSHEVLDGVISRLKLDMDYSTLRSSISISNPNSTRVLEVTVQTTDPELSKEIADAVCSTAAYKINKTMGINQVNLYSKGLVSYAQSNKLGMRKCALAGVAAAMFVYAIYFVAFLLDDKIKTEDDVERYLGLSVLGDIPNSNESKSKGGKYGRYSRYGRYGRYGKYSYYRRSSYGYYSRDKYYGAYRSDSPEKTDDTKSKKGGKIK